MLQPLDIPYTPYSDLKEGDEFIRLAMRPVLLRDLPGKRAGSRFVPYFFGRGESLEIRRMVRTPGGWLDETILDETILEEVKLDEVKLDEVKLDEVVLDEETV